MSKRRAPGEGGISEYVTARGPRWLVTYYVTDPVTGERRRVLRRTDHERRGFTTKKAAQTYLRTELAKADRGQWVDPSRQPLGDYLAVWLVGQRLRPSTVASYRKNVRLHIVPRLGTTPLSRLTATQINAWLRDLEATGRADGAGGLSARTTRYVFTILRSRCLTRSAMGGWSPIRPTAQPRRAPARRRHRRCGHGRPRSSEPS